MYDRTYKHDDVSRELSFEASGALMQASLVMRDRESDSWWSIMTSTALAGDMKGRDLVELPVGEKTTWADWRARHPETRVLSVDGREHEPHDPYRDYFASERTFGGLEIADKRLAPKEPIFAFWLHGKPHAVAQRLAEGGRLFRLEDGTRVVLYRPEGAEMFRSTVAYSLPADLELDSVSAETVKHLQRAGAPRLEGFDTFWYSWVAINENTRLLPVP